MPSVNGEDAVIRILTRIDQRAVHGAEARYSRVPGAGAAPVPQVHPGAVRHGARDGADRQRQDDTLYAALSEIKSVEDKIITIEDPVEYQLRGITQIPITKRRAHLRARPAVILRPRPGKIMVGEIRDPETAQIAIQSALTVTWCSRRSTRTTSSTCSADS